MVSTGSVVYLLARYFFKLVSAVHAELKEHKFNWFFLYVVAHESQNFSHDVCSMSFGKTCK